MSRTRLRRSRVVTIILALAGTVACSASSGGGNHPAVFLSEEVREVPAERCEQDTGLCVAVSGDVDGRATGEGSCRLYGPGDPDRLTPLAESGPMELVPGRIAEWVVALPGAVDVRQLNPVCRPMIEG